jgi:hypothetical protein
LYAVAREEGVSLVVGPKTDDPSGWLPLLLERTRTRLRLS